MGSQFGKLKRFGHNVQHIAKKLYHSFCYSVSGVRYACKTQWAFRFELILLVIAIPCALSLSHTLVECLLMISSVLLLPILELLNSAIETTVNRISLDYHELSKYAKDMASAALLLASLNAAIIWGVILLYYHGR